MINYWWNDGLVDFLSSEMFTFHLVCFVSWGILRDLKHATYDTRACDHSRYMNKFFLDQRTWEKYSEYTLMAKISLLK